MGWSHFLRVDALRPACLIALTGDEALWYHRLHERHIGPTNHTNRRDTRMSPSLLDMTKDLVQAQIHAGHLTPETLHDALLQTYASLARLKAREASGDRPAAPAHDRPTPEAPVDWKRSIRRHAITCLECGATFKQVSIRHLRSHDLDGRSYRAKYGIPRTQPLVAGASLARRREVVQRSRPWEKKVLPLQPHRQTRRA